MNARSRKVICLLFGSAMALPCVARAHAFLDHAEPKVGSEVQKAPSEVRIKFTQAIEPAFSTLRVHDRDHKEVDKKDAHVDPKDKASLVVTVEALPPGTYRVEWQVVSVDTHKTRGDFKFVVRP